MLGLVEALQRRLSVSVHHVGVTGVTHGILSGFSSRRSLPAPRPNLIVAAGHSTHVPLLQLGRRFGAATTVLMKPTFPLRLFDLCLIPDVYQFRRLPRNVLPTAGVLNRIIPSDDHSSDQGLLLTGGPCSHHRWSDQEVFAQITDVVRRSPQSTWRLATSRRTPASFIRMCRQVLPDGVFTPDDVADGWLPQQLRECGTVWVTQDSVSMMYEAVTSGALTGVVELPPLRSNRATMCVEQLIRNGDVTLWSDWQQSGELKKPARQLAEADRCTAELLTRGLLPVSYQTSTERVA